MVNIVKAKEVAQFLRLTELTIIKLAHEGQLPGFKIGGSWRFDMDEIMQQIQQSLSSKHGGLIQAVRVARRMGS